jgi:hypothetical protein
VSPEDTEEAPEDYRFLAALIQDKLTGFSAPVILELTVRANHQKMMEGQSGSQST